MSYSPCPGLGGTGPRCHPAICDCFIDTHPEDPSGIHPEDFVVSMPKTETEETHDEG